MRGALGPFGLMFPTECFPFCLMPLSYPRPDLIIYGERVIIQARRCRPGNGDARLRSTCTRASPKVRYVSRHDAIAHCSFLAHVNWNGITAGLLAILAAPVLLRIAVAILLPLILVAALAPRMGIEVPLLLLAGILLLILTGRRGRRVERNSRSR
jgi:hypothetical protein